MPPEHTWPAAQSVAHVPQLFRSLCVSRHEPPQLVRPVAHDTTQRPAEHTCPAAHAVPQAPQLARSLWRSRHEPPQSV